MVEPATPFVPGWHLDVITEHLEAVTAGQIRNLLINVPPRHMKSLAVAVFWPTWLWTTRPETRWLFNSYAENLSVRDSLKCRRVIQSPWYQSRWGSVFALTGDQNMKMRFENDRTGYRIASSVGGSNTGEGGDIIVVDDPHNVQAAESEAVRESVLTWWDEVMSTRLNNPATGARVIVQQRVHESDLAGHVLERGGYHHLCLPARYEPRVYASGCDVGAHDTRTVDGEPLWPARYPENELAALELEMGTYAAAGQLQQRPVPRAGAIFRSEWFRPLPPEFDTPAGQDKLTPRQRLRVVQFWDLAFSEAESADYLSAVTVGLDASANAYVLHVIRVRAGEARLVQVMADHIERTRPQIVGVEEGAFKQAATRDLVRRLAAELGTREAELALTINWIKPTTDKTFRAHLPAGRAEAGLVYADRSAPWWTTFEAELLRFPRGRHDDQVDALSGAMQLALEKVGTAAANDRLRLSGRPDGDEDDDGDEEGDRYSRRFFAAPAAAAGANGRR